MPLDRRRTERALTAKLGMEPRDGHRDDHRYYRFLYEGRTILQTKVSTGSGHRDIKDPIVAEMAKQMHIPAAFLREIVGCTKGLPEFVEYPESESIIE